MQTDRALCCHHCPTALRAQHWKTSATSLFREARSDVVFSTYRLTSEITT
jgi:hypothetical protein